MKTIFDVLCRYREFIVYCLIGCSGVLVDFSLFWLFRECIGVHYQVANFLSFSCANLSNFLLNTFFNFKVQDRLFLRFVSFYCVGLLNWVIGASFLFALFEGLGVNVYVAKGISVIIVTVVQFSLNKLLTFRKKNSIV